MSIKILKENGKKKIRIEETDNENELDLLIMQNGYQWSGLTVDNEMLTMIREAISEYSSTVMKEAINKYTKMKENGDKIGNQSDNRK